MEVLDSFQTKIRIFFLYFLCHFFREKKNGSYDIFDEGQNKNQTKKKKNWLDGGGGNNKKTLYWIYEAIWRKDEKKKIIHKIEREDQNSKRTYKRQSFRLYPKIEKGLSFSHYWLYFIMYIWYWFLFSSSSSSIFCLNQQYGRKHTNQPGSYCRNRKWEPYAKNAKIIGSSSPLILLFFVWMCVYVCLSVSVLLRLNFLFIIRMVYMLSFYCHVQFSLASPSSSSFVSSYD